MEITFHIFNNAPYCEMEAIFVVKGVLHWGTPQVERCYPRFTHPLQRGVGVIWGVGGLSNNYRIVKDCYVRTRSAI